MSRDLDKLIAEKVFGLEILDRGDILLGERFVCVSRKSFSNDGYIEKSYPIPHYSSRIEDAWLVVEHFQKIGKVEINVSEGYGCCSIYIRDKLGYGPQHLSCKESTCEAICLSALKAKESLE